MTPEQLDKLCGLDFRGRSIGQGEVLQRETSQTSKCVGDDCLIKASQMLKPRRFFGRTCAEVLENIRSKPILDIWGAQARVVRRGDIAQALSAGPDGVMGSCDDIERVISVEGGRSH